MKKVHIILVILVFSLGGSLTAQVKQADWIWQKVDGPANTWMAFRKEIKLDRQPKTALAKIAVDSKYWLWINGEMAVFEGGLKRGPNRQDTYCDEVDLAGYLKKGNNTIAVLVWFWGKGGSSHNDSKKGGLYFDAQIDKKSLVSDPTWKMMVHPAYKKVTSKAENDMPDNRLAEWPVIFDNRDNTIVNWMNPGFNDSAWENAVSKGKVPTAPWNNLVKRPIPFWKNSGLLDYVSINREKDKNGFISCRLPYDAQITPYLKIYSTSPGLTINILTDQFSYGRMRAAYVTAGKGWEEFEAYAWINGHKVSYQFPEGIEKWEVKYRETGYQTEFTGSIVTDDAFYNKLVEKAMRTLYVNMRDIFMDCPDRERSQWWGDVVIELNEVFFSFDTRAHALIQKAIDQLVGWQSPTKVLSSPLPIELPTQSLASVSDGFWTYYMHTGDLATIKRSYPAVRDYLNLWTMNDTTGLINQRGWNNGKVDRQNLIWNWDDHGVNTGENVDRRIIWNTWYYIAMKDGAKMAAITGHESDLPWYTGRMKSIEKNFDRIFWNEKLQRYRSSDYKGITDDRANAMAVYSGLAGKDKYPAVREELVEITEASAYMEKYIDEALYQMGYVNDAMARIKTRYSEMVNDSVTTTLWEHFQHRTDKWGSLNHGWTGWPMTLLAEYNTGINPTTPGYATFSVMPQMGTLKEIHQKVPSVKGEIAIDIKKESDRFSLKVVSPPSTTATLGIPQKELNNNFTGTGTIKINNTVVWKEGKYVGKLKGISYAGEENGYYSFTVQPGIWEISAR
jgi:alpha-L-rhamnosidase